MGTNWKGILAGVAPAIATALGSSGAGAAVKFLGDKFLGKPGANEAEVAAAVAGATPEQLEALRKLDQDFVLALTEKVVELDQIDATDRANARAREIAIKDHMPALLAVMLSVMVMACISLLAWHIIPSENREPFLLLAGSVSTCWIGAMAYFHGTSSGSKSKDAVIGRIASAR